MRVPSDYRRVKHNSWTRRKRSFVRVRPAATERCHVRMTRRDPEVAARPDLANVMWTVRHWGDDPDRPDTDSASEGCDDDDGEVLFTRVNNGVPPRFLCAPPIALPQWPMILADASETDVDMVIMNSAMRLYMLFAKLGQVATPGHHGFWSQKDFLARSISAANETTFLMYRSPRGAPVEYGTLLCFATISHRNGRSSGDEKGDAYIRYFQSFDEAKGHAREMLTRLRDLYPRLYVDSPLDSARPFWDHMGYVSRKTPY